MTLRAAVADVERELRVRASVTNSIGQIDPPYTGRSLLAVADFLRKALDDDAERGSKCWDCGEEPVEREGYICDECSARGAAIANGSLDADRAERGADDGDE